MSKFKIMLILAFTLVTIQVQAADNISLKTPRGASVTVVANFPPGPGPFPTVILGPGTGTMKQKVNDVVENALIKHGIAVLRFEWAYYVKDKNGKPSDFDNTPEIEDFAAVVALAKVDKRVDANAIVVGGKSRGSRIAWKILRNDPSLLGVLQLTPVCTKDGFTVDQLYPELQLESRPSLWISGNADPACNNKTLYNFLSLAGGPARIAILRGDHGLALENTSNIAAELAADFVLELTKH